MKTIVILTMIVVFWATGAMAQDKDKPPPKVQCPKTTMQEDCLKCHIVGNFKVRETLPDAHLSYPNTNTKILGWETTKTYGYFSLKEISDDAIRDFFRYLDQHRLNMAIVEIHSPGGALFDAQRIVNIMLEWQSKGNIIETRLYGIAASAGFYIFQAGNKRLVSPNADLLWHEIRTIEGWGLPRVMTPSDKEQEAKVFRHLQDIRNNWLATRCKLTKEKIDELIKYKDWWMSGKQAIEFGFADGYI